MTLMMKGNSFQLISNSSVRMQINSEKNKREASSSSNHILFGTLKQASNNSNSQSNSNTIIKEKQ